MKTITPTRARFFRTRSGLATALVLVLALALAITTAGCASAPSPQNRLSCTTARDAGLFTLMFAAVGITFRVAAADAKEACDKAPAVAAPAAPAASLAGK